MHALRLLLSQVPESSSAALTHLFCLLPTPFLEEQAHQAFPSPLITRGGRRGLTHRRQMTSPKTCTAHSRTSEGMPYNSSNNSGTFLHACQGGGRGLRLTWKAPMQPWVAAILARTDAIDSFSHVMCQCSNSEFLSAYAVFFGLFCTNCYR